MQDLEIDGSIHFAIQYTIGDTPINNYIPTKSPCYTAYN